MIISFPKAIGFCSLVAVFFILSQRPSPYSHLPLIQKILKIDPSGAILLASSFTCLFLALEYGGIILPWSSPRVWGCILGFGLIAIVFSTLQIYRKKNALMPTHIVRRRTVWTCCIFSCMYGIAIMVHSMLLPTYMQTVHNVSATLSGAYVLPMAGASTFCIVITGFSITAMGYYVPFLWVGPLVYMAGSILLYKLTPESKTVEYLGYQVLTGIGFGMTIHVSLIAIQAVVSGEDMPTACGMELISHQLGGAIGASVGQNIFVSQLKTSLQEFAHLSQSEAGVFAESGLKYMVDKIATMQNDSLRQRFRQALNDAITTAFIIPIAATGLAAVISWFVEWGRIDVRKPDTKRDCETKTES